MTSQVLVSGAWLLLAALAAACSSSQAPRRASPVPVAAMSPVSGPASTAAPEIRFVGRVQRTADQGARYAWSGSGFVARFQGTGVSVRLKDDKNQHTVVLDGTLRDVLETDGRTEPYVLAQGLAPGQHRLEVYRRSEALFGPTELLELLVHDGHLLPAPAASERRIEIVGDSISAGYGDEGPDTRCSFSADTENHYASYGAVLARALGAELSTVAWSGRGVIKNYDGGPGDPMPVLFERTLPEEQASRWDFSWVPQAVVVNLGTNDFSTEPDPPQESFVAAYRALLERVRSVYPSAFVLCTVGPMLGGEDLGRARRGIAEAVRQRRTSGDGRVVAYEMQTPNPSPGCDWHPSTATHARMAAELAGELERALGWSSRPALACGRLSCTRDSGFLEFRDRSGMQRWPHTRPLDRRCPQPTSSRPTDWRRHQDRLARWLGPR
jgi:lysophospholipase L1-like esterase